LNLYGFAGIATGSAKHAADNPVAVIQIVRRLCRLPPASVSWIIIPGYGRIGGRYSPGVNQANLC